MSADDADEVDDGVGDDAGGLEAREIGEARHLDPEAAAERLTALLEVPVSTRTTGYFAMTSIPDAPDAGVAFGVAVTAFEDGILERFAATMKGYRSQSKREALLAQVVTAAAA